MPGRSAKVKGSKGEREVVAMFRAAGFDRAARSPGSGSLRPYGAGDMSPWPGDLAFVTPFMVEVKYDERVEAGGVRTWPGSTFVKATLRDLAQLQRQHASIVGRRAAIPVLFARANLHPWRVWVNTLTFHKTYWRMEDEWFLPATVAWAEITPEMFFSEVVPRVRD